MAYKASLCPGCGQPRHESFDIAMDDRYDVEVLQCHACAARGRRAWRHQANREPGSMPEFGEFYIARPEDGDL